MFSKYNIKRYIKNVLICYLAILTGCTNTGTGLSSPSLNVKNNSSNMKNENKYNLPTLDMPVKKEEIKINDKNLLDTPYDIQEQSKNTRDKKTGDAVDLQTMAMGLANSQVSQSVKDWFKNKHATAELSINAGESGIRTGSFDLLVPIVDSEKDLFFTQLGIRRSNKFTEDYRNTVNFGLGYRHTMEKWLLGVNSFYDRDTTAGNERLGLGLEAWTDYLKLSGNSYMRLSDWKQSKAVEDYQERPANGWDLRAEAYLPQYPQLGGKLMYEQYYGDEVGLFGSSSRQKDPSATTVGLSYTPIPLVSVGTDYRQGQNGLSETSVKLGLNFQLGVPLKKQLSSDELKASRLLSNARYNLVSRNNEIVLDFKQNETGTITLPAQIKGGSNEVLSFPVNITGEVRNVTWTGNASSYAKTYGGSATASLTMPIYNNKGINNYTLQAIGSDKYGKLITSNVMQIGVESLKISVESSARTALANGVDEIMFTAFVTKQTGEIVSNSDVKWDIQGNALVVQQENKTDESGRARLRINSKTANTIVITVSEISGININNVVTFLPVNIESTAKVVSITATPNNITADGISISTLVATVQDENNKPVKKGEKVDWTTTIGELSSASTETDENGKATVTIKSLILGTAKVKATSIKGSFSTNMIFNSIPQVLGSLNISSSSETIQADNISQMVFKVIAKDTNNKLIKNLQINWSKNINDVKISNLKSITDENGEATIVITSGITSGDLIVTANAVTTSVNKVIKLIAPPVKQTIVELTASSETMIADGLSNNTFIVAFKDSDNIPIQNIEVNWTTTGVAGILSTTKSVTDSSGKASVIVKAGDTAGNLTVTATSIKGSANKVISLTQAPVKIVSLKMVSNFENVVADGQSQSVFTITAIDSDNNPVSNLKINWSKSGSDGVLSTDQSLTNSSGQANVTFTSGFTIGDLTITATTVNGSITKSIKLVSPPIKITQIEVSSNNDTMVADGLSQTVYTATIKDSNGGLVTNQIVNWSKNLSDVILSVDKSTTNSLGQATVTVKSGLTAGDLVITATIDNINKSKTIKLTPIPVSSPTFTLTALSPIIFADEVSSSTLVATFKDGSGNPIANSEIDWSSTVGAIEHPKTLTDSNGQSTNRIRSVKTATTSVITATTGGISQNVSVEFEFATARVTAFDAQPQSIKADGVETTTLTATVKNLDGSVARAGIPVNFSQGIQNFNNLSSNRALTDSAGKAYVTFSGTVSLKATISAGVDSEGSIVNTVVDLTPIYNYSATIDTPSPASIKADGIDSTNLVAHVKNDDGTPAPNIRLNWATEDGNLSSNSTTTDSNGTSTVRFSSTKIGSAFILAIPIGANTSKAGFTNVAVVKEVVPISTSIVILTSNSYLVSDSYTDPGSGTVYPIIGGIIAAKVTKQDGPVTIPVSNKRVTFECIDGSKCLSQTDGSSLLPATTVTTDSNGLAYIQFGPSVNPNNSILFRAVYEDDVSVTPDQKVLSVK